MKLTNTLISKVFDMTPQGIGKWKKEQRPIIKILEQYFNKDDLIEYINTNKISKLERLQELEEIEKKYKAILEITK